MARTNNLSNFLTDVAGAIKEKKGSEIAIPASQFDTEIRNLPSQGTYQHKTVPVTQNGTQIVIPDAGYDAIDELTINTAVPEKQLQTKSYTFTQNANLELTPDSGYDGFDQVNLKINVQGGGEVNNQDITITENGVYTADVGYTGIGTATVNIPIPQDLDYIIPNSIEVDEFVSLNNILLFTIPKDFNGVIVVTPYGKGDDSQEWTVRDGVDGNYHIEEGTVSDAVKYDFGYINALYTKLEVLLVKDGYNPLKRSITVTKTVHNYGLVKVEIDLDSVRSIMNEATIVCTNLDDNTIQPLSVVLDSTAYWPTWNCSLPEGNWEFSFHYNTINEVLQSTYVSNNSIGMIYGYPNLPGFNVSFTILIADEQETISEGGTANGVITVYNSNDEVITTYNIPYKHKEDITYFYIGEFDHYTVSITCWETGTTFTETYTESITDIKTFTLSDTISIYTLFTHLDGEMMTSASELTSLIQNIGLTLKEYDSNDVTFVKNADYVVLQNTPYNDNGAAIIRTKTTFNNYLHIDSDPSQSQYEPFNISILTASMIASTSISFFHRQPVITFNVALQDIDGDPIPYGAEGLEVNVSNSDYEIINNNGNSLLRIPATKNRISNGELTCMVPAPNYGDNMKYLLATYEELSSYTEDTTITTSLRLPVTNRDNYKVFQLKIQTVDGIDLSSVVNSPYPTITNEDGTVQYTPLYVPNYNRLADSTNTYYTICVPVEETIVFHGTTFTINETSYHSVDYSGNDTSYSNKYYAYVYGPSNSVFVENTSQFSGANVMLYEGGNPTGDYEGMHKIDVYKNGVLVDSDSTFGGYYQCRLSFFANDNVEFRIYKNESTADNPQWSERYMTLLSTVVTEAYQFLPFPSENKSGIYLEEVDAYINQETYINKHADNILAGVNDPIISVSTGEEIDLFATFEVCNARSENITAYMTTITGGFNSIDGQPVDISEYTAEYNISTGKWTYTGTGSLSAGPTVFEINVTDSYASTCGTSVSTNIN